MKKMFFLISHNEYALGLKKALEMIIGKQDNLVAYGLMPGGHPDEIIEQIENGIDDRTEVVILGDIAGGSVCNSALRLTSKQNITLVTGMNLPLAMEIIVTQTTEKEAIEAIVSCAREGMKVLEIVQTAELGGADFF
ncbi:PTS sugar transporter subunit IIA [Trichococcus collinsii]|uniref:PTS system, mannose-specific IIA component n=1 Tax=Trichococcus collinsii TaxID=157076 RepID=A0AB38A3S2_9LACT|nr:PTS mannose transporter subunit IIA [Trichococcus collinsii]CZQ99354.1 phosphotransferase system mannose-type iia component [Trichococcus collinsii]SEA93216.1 PTS system, mannose-specific IIA component [Trichococcus collinsii]